MPNASRFGRLGWLVLSLLVLVIDQVSKAHFEGTLEMFQQIVVIPDYFSWTLAYNTGAAFSFLADSGGWQRWLFALIAVVVSAVLVLIGLRMGMGALKMWRMGLLNKEFPRYQYQRRRWEKDGKSNVQLALQVDAVSQGLANASFLALPVFIIASNDSPRLSMFELAGLVIWLLAFAMETVADFQKIGFLQKMKREGKARQVCDVGLWRYSRHPNYFAEWMVWNALVIAAIPSWLALQSTEDSLLWMLLGVGLLFTSRMMYSTLVYATGAVPSEYYSVQKRPGYTEYQQRTNRFFPGPRRES